jgi:methyltransferase (TIGR00027 family)
VTRTYLFDSFISLQIAQGVDMVVNLAAGLDARPYRMALPASLTWVEIDLPEILDYKEEALQAEKAVCRLERVRLDLADVEKRRALFDALGRRAKKVLALAEGLLVYLSAKEVASLAEGLSEPLSFESWVVDLVSPGLLRMLQKATHSQFNQDVVPLKFGPPEGPQFFARCGWRPTDVRSVLQTAAQLKRVSWFMRLLALLPQNPASAGSRPWGGVCLLAKVSRAAGSGDG